MREQQRSNRRVNYQKPLQVSRETLNYLCKHQEQHLNQSTSDGKTYMLPAQSHLAYLKLLLANLTLLPSSSAVMRISLIYSMDRQEYISLDLPSAGLYHGVGNEDTCSFPRVRYHDTPPIALGTTSFPKRHLPEPIWYTLSRRQLHDFQPQPWKSASGWSLRDHSPPPGFLSTTATSARHHGNYFG